jgi:eukaryotic-like serine/threonine-protein kinase
VSEARAARFKRLEPLLDRAFELEGEARERFLLLCADIYPDLVSDLRRALAPDAALLPDIGAVAASASTAPATDRRGLVLGNWRLLERLGRGGMGSVYRAERLLPAGLQAAVKMLRIEDAVATAADTDGGRSAARRDLFERERALLARLDHPGIARLIDGGNQRDAPPFLVLELAPGLDLDDWLEQVMPDLPRRLAVLLQIAEAVAYAHSCGVLHRDLKPSNVRVDVHDRSKLLDFGIGKSLDATPGATRIHALTPDWAAPEQLLGRPTATGTDVYALGALLYLMLTGRGPHPAFDGDWSTLCETCAVRVPVPPSRADLHAPDTPIRFARAPGGLDSLALAALAPDPAQRPRSAAAFAAALRTCLEREA